MQGSSPQCTHRIFQRTTITDNKKALFDYLIEGRYEAGITLKDWEVKATRANRAQIKGGYVVTRNAELSLIGAHINPLQPTSTCVHPDPVRTRKLLLHTEEIKELTSKMEQRGYTLASLSLYHTRGRVKYGIDFAKGKKLFDKRETERDRDWQHRRARFIRGEV